MKIAASLLLLLSAQAQNVHADVNVPVEDEGECVGDLMPEGMSAADVARHVFESSDSDASGSLSLDEIGSVSLGEKHLAFLAAFDIEQDGLDAADFANFLGAYDASGDGAPNMKEFTNFIVDAEKLDAAFKKADKDNSLHLSVGEVRMLMDGAGGSEEAAAKLASAKALGIDFYDRNGDGSLTEAEINGYGAATDVNRDGRIEHLEALSLIARASASAHPVSDEILAEADKVAQEKQAAKDAAAAQATKDAEEAKEKALATKQKKTKKKAKHMKGDSADPQRDFDAAEVEQLGRRKVAQRRAKMRRSIPTPTGRAQAARLAAADDILEEEELSPEEKETQMRHFLTPAQIKKREQEKLKKENRQRRLEERKQAEKPDAVAAFKKRVDSARNAFANVDVDQNGVVTLKELKVLVPESTEASKVFDKMDENKNSKLASTEFTKYWPFLLKLRPENEDFEEADSTLATLGRNSKTGKPKKRRMLRVIAAKAHQAKKLFAARDDNQDGVITVQELEYFHMPGNDAEAFMGEYDDDRNNKLSEEEFINGFPEISRAASIYRRSLDEQQLRSSDQQCPNHVPPERTLAEKKAYQRAAKAKQQEIIAAHEKARAAAQ